MLLKLSDHPFMKHLEARRAEQQAFAEQDPELAADWHEAILENERRDRSELERALASERRVNGLQSAGIPERLREALLGGVEMKETSARAAVRSIPSAKPVLLLCGSPGCGKTFAAASALAEALDSGLVDEGLFVKSFELSRLSMFAPEDKRRLEQVSRTRFLVLDDLGAEMLHDGLRPMLDEIVDARYQSGSRTILTTNLDPQAFKQRYGERIADRIREVGRVVLCGDKSLRRPTP